MRRLGTAPVADTTMPTARRRCWQRCAHWRIENSMHWVLKVALREDDTCIRREPAPQNMAILRRIAHNLLKQK